MKSCRPEQTKEECTVQIQHLHLVLRDVCQQEMELGTWSLVSLRRTLYVKVRLMTLKKYKLGSAMIIFPFSKDNACYNEEKQISQIR